MFNAFIDGKPAYATSDLLEQHPTKPHLFRVFGRVDDQLMLSTGEKTNPAPLGPCHVLVCLALYAHVSTSYTQRRSCWRTRTSMRVLCSVADGSRTVSSSNPRRPSTPATRLHSRRTGTRSGAGCPFVHVLCCAMHAQADIVNLIQAVHREDERVCPITFPHLQRGARSSHTTHSPVHSRSPSDLR